MEDMIIQNESTFRDMENVNEGVTRLSMSDTSTSRDNRSMVPTNEGDVQILENVVHPPPCVLTEAQNEKLVKEKLVSQQLISRYEKDSRRNWDLFYKRNKNNFYKDRHWLTNTFSAWLPQDRDATFSLVEVGCGVGNLFFPLKAEYSNLRIYAFDLSLNAINIIKEHEAFDAKSMTVFTCDATETSLTDNIPAESLDMASLMFVLSAMHPNKMHRAVLNVAAVLKPGAIVIFRDYGMYDEAMLRFKSGAKLADRFYVRNDGTRAFYFDLNEAEALFRRCGLTVVHAEYAKREVVNRKEQKTMNRIFVQMVLRK